MLVKIVVERIISLTSGRFGGTTSHNNTIQGSGPKGPQNGVDITIYTPNKRG